jgi:hypothetical protein
MTFSPILPMSGYAGWSFLKRTMPAQVKAFESQAAIKRNEAYFRANIGKIDKAEQLVNDPRLLRVALSAFGLENDVRNKFFIRKVLEEGTLTTSALANKLSDKQYAKLSNAFGFGNPGVAPRTKLSDFADGILKSYRVQQFSVAVGEQNDDMRLALNAERELPVLAKSSSSETAKWFTILGNAPLRRVFEKSFGLPSSFGAIDIDKQVETLKARTRATFDNDSVQQFTKPANLDKLVRQFLIRSEVDFNSAALSRGQVALTLLQSSAYPKSYAQKLTGR